MKQENWNTPDWLHVGEPEADPQPHRPGDTNMRRRSAMLVLGGFIVGCAVQPLMEAIRPTSDAERAFYQTYEQMEQNWLYRDEVENYADYLWESAIVGMTTYSRDPYTAYRSPEQTKQRMNQLGNTEAGVGVQILHHPADGGFYVLGTVAGAGAEAAGVRPHDKLVAVDDQTVEGMTLDDLVGMMSGENGSTVSLTFSRGGEVLEPMEVTRSTNAKRTASGRIEGDTGILTISSFSGTTGQDTERELARMEAQGIEQLIIDLRGNGGGLLTACADVATHLTEGRNVVLYGEDNQGERHPAAYTDPNAPTYHFDRIAVLVDANTASAAEVLTLYLREMLGAAVVGEQTFGKGVVQNLYPLANGGSLTMTELEWLSPDGKSINEVGITPDVEVSVAATHLGTLPQLAPGERYSLGDEGEVCAAVQANLQMLGYEVGEVDGYFGLRTQLAVLAYQRDSTVLEVNGVITPDLLLHLYIDASNYLRENAMQADQALMQAVEVLSPAQPEA